MCIASFGLRIGARGRPARLLKPTLPMAARLLEDDHDGSYVQQHERASSMIKVFNTATESFRKIPAPPVPRKANLLDGWNTRHVKL